MDEQLLARLESIENRLGNIENSLISGKGKNNNTTALVLKYVALPLILILGALAGVKLFFPM